MGYTGKKTEIVRETLTKEDQKKLDREMMNWKMGSKEIYKMHYRVKNNTKASLRQN